MSLSCTLWEAGRCECKWCGSEITNPLKKHYSCKKTLKPAYLAKNSLFHFLYHFPILAVLFYTSLHSYPPPPTPVQILLTLTSLPPTPSRFPQSA